MAMAAPLGLTDPDPDEYIGFPGDGGTVWVPDYLLDTI